MVLSLIDLLFPARCLACGGAGRPFCVRCMEGVAAFSPPWCERCGRPTAEPLHRCAECPAPSIAWARTAFLYEGPVRAALLRLKFGGSRSVADAFGPAMAQALQRAPPVVSAAGRHDGPGDSLMLTWVPLGRRRKRSRGYDQAEALARAVARLVGLPAVLLLERTVDTDPQARRPASERARAIRGSFRCTRRPPPRVVLVDDVLTSGATGAECAKTLLAGGAREIGLLTAARSLGGGVPARCYNPAGLRPGSVVARETLSR